MSKLMEKVVGRSIAGFVIGAAANAFLFASVLLYIPFVFGYDSVLGPAFNELFVPGYVLTRDDVDEIIRFGRAATDIGKFGLLLGIAFALIGAVSAWPDHKKPLKP